MFDAEEAAEVWLDPGWDERRLWSREGGSRGGGRNNWFGGGDWAGFHGGRGERDGVGDGGWRHFGLVGGGK